MLHYTKTILKEMEADSEITSREQAFSRLRHVGLDDFGEVLLLMPMAEFPKLSGLLPHMASDETQNLWTGQHGYPLLRQSCNFVRSVVYNYQRIVGTAVNAASILDYGCGYGRIARLMYYFVAEEAVVGVDPWQPSLDECSRAGLGPNFLLSQYLPEALPTSLRFDLAYAFSVFTHTSKRATLCALSSIRKSMRPGGVLCLTIRPPEYWQGPYSAACPTLRLQMLGLHETVGFAFTPHLNGTADDQPAAERLSHYGDTSMSLRWLESNAKGWKFHAIDRSLEDPYQIYVFVQAV